MRANVAPTDGDWWRFLAALPDLTEANFWVPAAFKTYGLPPNSPVIFKSKVADGNRLVGGGWLAEYLVLPVSEAWVAFGKQNGCQDVDELLDKVNGYRGRLGKPALPDPPVGCVRLRDTVFFPAPAMLSAPRDFPMNSPGPKGYDVGAGGSPEVTAAVAQMTLLASSRFDADFVWHHDGPRFGSPIEVVPRLGQSSFKAKVADAYRRECAITRAKVRPILQAAHIRPYADDGPHRVDNGLLLRADVHILFDQGYLSVHPGRHELVVSKRIREVWGNGREFYDREGASIELPDRLADRPNPEFLTWHMDAVFQR